MFGAQELSNRRTAPAHGFGSSTRNHAAKVFMGSEHAKTASASCTPGPSYEVAGACGNQQDSGKVSPPQWCFGTADRFSGSPRKRSPGPGAYDNAGAFGKQGLSNRSTFPRYGFGTVDRAMASKVHCFCPFQLARRAPKPRTRVHLSIPISTMADEAPSMSHGAGLHFVGSRVVPWAIFTRSGGDVREGGWSVGPKIRLRHG